MSKSESARSVFDIAFAVAFINVILCVVSWCGRSGGNVLGQEVLVVFRRFPVSCGIC
jgi:hypothetical protein